MALLLRLCTVTTDVSHPQSNTVSALLYLEHTFSILQTRFEVHLASGTGQEAREGPQHEGLCSGETVQSVKCLSNKKESLTSS